jgi:FixJ family two-component response regulator
MIFITAQAHERIRDQALNNGAIAFLEKPFSTEALLRAVDSAGVRTSTDGSLKNSTA